MSHIIRSAKSGSDWTSNELDAYNIVIRNQSPRSFYGQDLPAAVEGIDPDFLVSDVTNEAVQGDLLAPLSDSTHRLLMYLDLATKANAGAPPFTEFVLVPIHNLRIKVKSLPSTTLPRNRCVCSVSKNAITP